jgi:hypothetical protein
MLFPHWVDWTHPSFYIIFRFLVYVSRLTLLFVSASSLLFGMSCLFPQGLLLICLRVLHYYTILFKVWVLYNVTRITNPRFVFIWWRDILKVYEMLYILYNLFYDMYVLRFGVGVVSCWHHSCIASHGSGIWVVTNSYA